MTWTHSDWIQMAVALFTFAYLVTTIFIFCEMRHTNRVVSVQGTEALRLTRDSNDLAREALTASNRAIIALGPIGDPNAKPITLDDGKSHQIPIEFKNVGRSPATNVRTWIQTALLPKLPEDLTFHFTKPPAAPTAIGPNDARDVVAFILPMSKSESGKIDDGSLNLYMWVQAQYEDGFGNERLTQFCFRYDPIMSRWADVGERCCMT